MLHAISPVDGRYSEKTKILSEYFSEFALIKYRIIVEVEYFIELLKADIKPLKKFPKYQTDLLGSIISNFSEEDAIRIKEIEKTTNHDVKAVEYFLKEKFAEFGFEDFSEIIHFGLTSQDINNTAIPLSLRDGVQDVFLPAYKNLLTKTVKLCVAWKDKPMLAHTHGQPASPTTMGKELAVFAHRLQTQITNLENQKIYAKFGGAVGNLNAHYITFPGVDWMLFSNNFIHRIGLERIPITTQIDHYDHLAELFQKLKVINTILIDLCRDIWTYISMGYFSQKTIPGEIGSSTMPHKVNPIDFENAEGNLGMANAIYTFLSDKLPISRLQRDLTDSTVLRNIGVPMAHSLIAIHSVTRGLDKLKINEAKLSEDLDNNWAVVAEAYQSILRREGISKPYELLKDFTRGRESVTREDMHAFIKTLPVNESLKQEMLDITPENYTGLVDFLPYLNPK